MFVAYRRNTIAPFAKTKNTIEKCDNHMQDGNQRYKSYVRVYFSDSFLCFSGSITQSMIPLTETANKTQLIISQEPPIR